MKPTSMISQAASAGTSRNESKETGKNKVRVRADGLNSTKPYRTPITMTPALQTKVALKFCEAVEQFCKLVIGNSRNSESLRDDINGFVIPTLESGKMAAALAFGHKLKEIGLSSGNLQPAIEAGLMALAEKSVSVLEELDDSALERIFSMTVGYDEHTMKPGFSEASRQYITNLARSLAPECDDGRFESTAYQSKSVLKSAVVSSYLGEGNLTNDVAAYAMKTANNDLRTMYLESQNQGSYKAGIVLFLNTLWQDSIDSLQP